MDYEKKYKCVLNTARQWIKDGCSYKERICLECCFPELRESELTEFEDKLRKCMIIAGVTYMSEDDLNRFIRQHKEELLDAAKKELEKQGYYFYQKLEHTTTGTTERITDSTQVSNPDDPGFNYTKDTGKYLDECIKSATKSWKGVDVDKFMDEVRGRDDEEAKALLYVNDKAYQKGFKDGKMEAMKDIPKWKAVGYDNDEQEYPLCLTRYADVNGDYHYSFSSGKILQNLEYVSIVNLERLPKDETD